LRGRLFLRGRRFLATFLRCFTEAMDFLPLGAAAGLTLAVAVLAGAASPGVLPASGPVATPGGSTSRMAGSAGRASSG